MIADLFVRSSGVSDYIISHIELFVQWHLQFFSSAEFGLIPAPRPPHPLDPLRFRRIYIDDGIALLSQTGLQEQGSVPYIGPHRCIGCTLAHLIVPDLGDDGVNQSLQPESLLIIIEDDRSDLFPINLTIGKQDRRPPPLPQHLANLRPRISLADGRVGIDDHAAFVGEEIGDEALAAADAADQADDGFAREQAFAILSESALIRVALTLGAFVVNCSAALIALGGPIAIR